MIEPYYLNQNQLPKMPVPHDCVINRIVLQGKTISFYMDAIVDDEDDAIRFYHPDAKGLIIRYHQTEEDTFSIYKMKRSPRHLHKLFPPHYTRLDEKELKQLAERNHKLVYLDHYVGDNSIIWELFSEERIILNASVDCVEYEWLS